MACMIGHLSNEDATIYIKKINNNYKNNKLKNMSKEELVRELNELDLNKNGSETKLPEEFYIKEEIYEKLLIRLIKKKNKPPIPKFNFNNNNKSYGYNYGYNSNSYRNYMCVD